MSNDPDECDHHNIDDTGECRDCGESVFDPDEYLWNNPEWLDDEDEDD